MAEVRIYDSKIEALLVKGDVHREIQRKVSATVAVARTEAPVRTGRLRESIQSIYRGRGRWEIVAGSNRGPGRHVAKIVHHGTKPHEIRPRRRKALKFYWERVGMVVILRSVNHPGTKPDPFLTRAMHRIWD